MVCLVDCINNTPRVFAELSADCVTRYDSQVNSSVLRSTLLPAPRRCLDDIKALLPQLAAEKCAELLTTLRAANEKISGFDHFQFSLLHVAIPSIHEVSFDNPFSIPSTVEEFVEFMAFLTKISNEQQALDDQFSAITDLYNLMVRTHFIF